MGIDSEGMLISAVHEEDSLRLNLLMVDDHIPAVQSFIDKQNKVFMTLQSELHFQNESKIIKKGEAHNGI